MASAEKLKSGWRGIYYVHGKKCHTKPPHHPRKRDAIAAAENARVLAYRQAAQEDKTLSAGITWGEWWDLLSEKRVFGDSETGLLQQNLVALYLRPQWGETPLNKIKQRDVQEWVDALAAGTAVRNLRRECFAKAKLSPSSIRKVYGVLTVSINAAVPAVLDASPCVNIKLPKVPKKAQPYLSVGAQEKIGDRLRGDYKDALDFAMETGLRPGELCGLHICRVDLEVGWMQVSEVLVRRLKVIRPCPKDEDMRMVPLSDRAIEIAGRRIAGCTRTVCGLPHSDGSRCESDVLFRTSLDRIMSQNLFSDAMRRASVPAGLGRRGPYTTRRGAATIMANGGMDAYEMARIFGWSDINQAWAYVQQTPSARSRALAALRRGRSNELRVLPGGLGRSGMPAGTDLHPMVSDETG